MAAIFTTVVSLAYVKMITTYGIQGSFDPISEIVSYYKLGGLPVLGCLILLTAYRIISLILFSELVLFVS